MIKPEIVSPAGNIEKLEAAVKFGADAVYFGGGQFNLRAKAGNFTEADIERALEVCEAAGVKTIFLMNSFLHEKDIPAAEEYIRSMKDYPFSAVMVSDPGMISLIKKQAPGWDIHLSTQMSTLNSLSIEFWQKAGVSRIVLARETTLEEIKNIRKKTEAEIEVFIHGALCVAYSGRCLLSRYLSGKDANQGDCTQPCRWKYVLVEEKRPGNHLDIIEHGGSTEILSSKDLNLSRLVPEYMKAGVNAFKIEGRMKSLYYTAQTTRLYKLAVKSAAAGTFDEVRDFIRDELELVSHRPYTEDLFNEFTENGYDGVPYIQKVLFMGRLEGTPTGSEPLQSIKVFNPIRIGDSLDVIYPIIDKITDEKTTVKKILTTDDIEVDMARPGEYYKIEFEPALRKDAIIRKKVI